MSSLHKIAPFLWFDSEAEQAALYYVKAFPGSRITGVQRYPEGGPPPAGMVMTVSFELAGQPFTALNGGSRFMPNEAVSFVVSCDDQREVDFLWEYLGNGGETQKCGWLKDRWGFYWQIVPKRFLDILSEGDGRAKARAFEVMMQMTKFDLAKIEEAYQG